MRHRLLFAGCALGLGAWFLPSLAAPAGAASSLVQARTTATVTISDHGDVSTTIETLSLAAGSWTVTSDLTAVNFGAGDFVRCHLVARGAVFDGGATVYLANRVSGLTDVGTLTTSATTTVSVACGHDRDAATAGQFYVDPGATMIAVSANSIAGPGVAATSTTSVAQARTTAKVSFPVHPSSATVVTRSLPAGTWAVTGYLTAVDFAGADYAECQLAASSGASVSDSFDQPGVGAADDQAVRVDLEGVATIPSGGGSVSIACHTGLGTAMYADPGATLTATKTAPSAVVEDELIQTTLSSPGGSKTVVGSETVPAGTWRVRSYVNIGFAPRRDFLRCTLMANGASIDGGATVQITPDSEIEDVVDSGTFTSSSSWTLTLACSHDNSDTTSHWLTNGGHIVAVNTAAK